MPAITTSPGRRPPVAIATAVLVTAPRMWSQPHPTTPRKGAGNPPDRRVRHPYQDRRSARRSRPARTEMAAWLDENCGAGSWAVTPSGTRGVLNDAISIYFADATLASRRRIPGARGRAGAAGWGGAASDALTAVPT